MRIGDIVPVPDDFDPELAKIAMARRRQTVITMRTKGGNQSVAATRKAVLGAQAYAESMATPLEQAKTFLRRKGYVPVATIDGEHIVGRHRFARAADVIAFAQGRGMGE